MSKLILEETEVVYKNLSDLSFADDGEDNVELYVNDELIGEIDVFTDRGNEEREYICVNYEMIYLDTITKR